LKLYASSSTGGRTLEAVPLDGPWMESTLTWFSQPGTMGDSVMTDSGDGYREWDVTTHVQGMLDAGVSYGWVIRDSVEGEDGGDQEFVSREEPQDPPPSTLPVLVLKYEAGSTVEPDSPSEAVGETVVYCGQVITQSTRVHPDSDLTACMGEGLVIGGPHIVLDLNGEVIASGALVEPGEEVGLCRESQWWPHQRCHSKWHGARVRLWRTPRPGNDIQRH
jgi:hypothetical protein